MARYTSSFAVADSHANVRQAIVNILDVCNLSLIGEKTDYFVAREKLGAIAFAQLATVEFVMDKNPSLLVRVDVIVRSHELPLRANNHCAQVFALVSHAIADRRNWQVLQIES